MQKSIFSFLLYLFVINRSFGQSVVPVPFGDFEQWTVRIIKESGIIGGNTRTMYMIAPSDTIIGHKNYEPSSLSSWGTSNALANVAGIVKTSVTVFPEQRPEGGYCARMDTQLATCKVLGIVNITVLASGSIFLGQTEEPIRSANNPMSKVSMGIPFQGHPKNLIFDYKAKISQDSTVTRAKISSFSEIPGRDKASAFVLLQHRWEDDRGNIYAKRVGTGKELFDRSTDHWVNGYKIPILYGDITSHPDFRDYMDLLSEESSYYCRNSYGKMVPIQEVGWGDENEPVTHMILMFSSGCLGAYIGALGNSFWVDNVKLEY